MRYRKKPVVIEALSVLELLIRYRSNFTALPDWAKEAYKEGTLMFEVNSVSIVTLEGTMHGNDGDFIICGVQGELYPCKADIFYETYEKVEDD